MTRPIWAPWRLEYIGEAGTQDGCVFCMEAAGELGEHSLAVHRGERGFVLLNKFPYASGHLMVASTRPCRTESVATRSAFTVTILGSARRTGSGVEHARW